MNEFESARNRYVDRTEKCGRANDPGKMEGNESKGYKSNLSLLRQEILLMR